MSDAINIENTINAKLLVFLSVFLAIFLIAFLNSYQFGSYANTAVAETVSSTVAGKEASPGISDGQSGNATPHFSKLWDTQNNMSSAELFSVPTEKAAPDIQAKTRLISEDVEKSIRENLFADVATPAQLYAEKIRIKLADKSTSMPDIDFRFVSVLSGNDSNIGSIDSPWKSIERALQALTPGSVIVIREGIYYEGDLAVSTRGTPRSPVMIMGYPGEDIVIDGSLQPELENAASAWTLIDKDRQVYHLPLSNKETQLYTAKIKTIDAYTKIVTYSHKSENGAAGLLDMLSDNHDVSVSPRYVGPGIYSQGANLFMRTQALSDDSVFDRNGSKFEDTDPVTINLSLSARKQIFLVSGSHIYFAGMVVRGATKGFMLRKESDNISVYDVAIDVNAIGLHIDDGVSHIVVDDCTFVGSYPEWLAWTDMKGGDGQSKPAQHWSNRPTGISGSQLIDILVVNNVFDDVFDGIIMDGDNIEVAYNYGSFVDDMIQLGSNSTNTEIHHNYIIGAGPSHNGKSTSKSPGTRYLYNNVIDATHMMLWGKRDPKKILRESYSGWGYTLPFSRHSLAAAPKGDPWKIYNNTVFFNGTASKYGPGYQLWGQLNGYDSPHEVYNNIFVDVFSSRFNAKIDVEVEGQIYDGNIYWAPNAGAAAAVYENMIAQETSKSSQGVDFKNLSEFRRSKEFEKTKNTHAPGWDSESFFADPQLTHYLIPAPGGRSDLPGVQLPEHFPLSEQRHRGAFANTAH